MAASFIGDAEEVEAFKREWQARTLRPAADCPWPFGGSTPTDLQEAVRRTVSRLNVERATANSAVLGIAVEIQDGLSWSAEKAAETVREAGPDWEPYFVALYTGEGDAAFKQLVDLIGDRAAVRRAMRKSNLVPELYRPLAPLAAAVLVAVALGAAGTLLSSLAIGTAAPLSVGVLVLAGLLAWVAKSVTPQLTPMPAAEVDRRIAQALAKQPNNSEAEDKFEQAIVAALDPERRRVVIVEGLNETSAWVQKVIKRYLEGEVHTREQQIWILFSRARQAGASARTGPIEPVNAPELNTLKVGGRFAWWLCRQGTLTKDDKQRLLEKRDGRPVGRDNSRLRPRTVGRVVDRERIEWEGDQPNLPELDDLTPAELRAFALLAVAAAVPDPEPVEASDLDAIARGSSAEDAWLTRLLKEWFPEGDQNAASIESAFDEVARRLSVQLEEPTTGRVRTAMRVRRSFSDALRTPAAWNARELPSQDLAHAFWAAYTERELLQRRQWSASVADRLIWHLRAIKEPTRLRSSGRAELADRLFQTTLDGAEAALALCVEGLVARPVRENGGHSTRGLYQQARLLLADDAAAPDAVRTERLCTSAWLAYQLTGEPALVGSLNALNADLGASPPTEPTDALLRLFCEMVPGVESAPVPSPDDMRTQAAVLDHARIRAAWLVAILTPIIDGRAPRLAAAAEATSGTVPPILDGALARLGENGDDDTAALDHLTLIHLALCDAVVAARDPARPAEARERCELLLSFTSARLALGSNPRARVHYMLDGLLRQLDSTARASLGFVAEPQLARSAELRRAALEELENLHVMWHNMELYELADLAAMSRAAFDLIGHPNAMSTAAPGSSGGDYLVGLTAGGAAVVHRMEVALLVGVPRLAWNMPAASVPLLEAANLAIVSGIGDQLAVELCRLVLPLSSNTPALAQAEQIAAYLLDPPGQPGALDVPDDDLIGAADSLLACVTSTRSPVGERIVEAIRRRNTDVASEWVKDRIEQSVEHAIAFHDEPPSDPEELAELLSSWRRRAWGEGTATSANPQEPRPSDYLPATRRLYCDVLTYVLREGVADEQVEADAAKLLAAIPVEERTLGAVQLAYNLCIRLELAPPPEAAARASAGPAPEAGTATAPVPFGLSVDFPQAEQVASSPRKRLALALEVQRSAIAAVAGALSPEHSYAVYLCLARHHDGQQAVEYWSKGQFWRAADERLKQEALFDQYQRGRFFEVFWHHFRRVPELPLDGDWGQLRTLLDDPHEQLWNLTEPIPDPLELDERDNPIRICSRFVRAGYFLFHGAAEDARSAQAAEARRQVDVAAGRAIHGLYRLLVENPSLTPELHEIYRQQHSRFDAIDGERNHGPDAGATGLE